MFFFLFRMVSLLLSDGVAKNQQMMVKKNPGLAGIFF